jgi:hypothetical protein
MKFLKNIFLVFMMLIIGLSIGVGVIIIVGKQDGKNQKGSEKSQTTERNFAYDRKNWRTKLLIKGPAPQEYETLAPPAGVREVFYDSSDLKLKAWVSEDPGDSK